MTASCLCSPFGGTALHDQVAVQVPHVRWLPKMSNKHNELPAVLCASVLLVKNQSLNIYSFTSAGRKRTGLWPE